MYEQSFPTIFFKYDYHLMLFRFVCLQEDTNCIVEADWNRLTYQAQVNICMLVMNLKNSNEVETKITDWIATKNAKYKVGKKQFVGHLKYGTVEKVEMVTNWALDAGIVEIVDAPTIVKGRLELSMDNIRLGKEQL